MNPREEEEILGPDLNMIHTLSSDEVKEKMCPFTQSGP